MKTCFKCQQQKPLSDFYKHPMMADGHLNKCKDCARSDVRQNRARKRKYYSEFDQKRRQSPNRKAMKKVYERRGRIRHPDKYKARMMAKNAIRDGRLIRQPCEVCGTQEQVEAHHEDYSRPFDVRWLCFQHHREAHGQVVVAATR